MAATIEQESAEILPLDRYIRAVTICNNLALLTSQGTVTQFFQRIAILSRLQRYWTKGFDTVQLSCAEADALFPDSDGDDDGGGLSSLVPVSNAADWDARSDSTVDLKPDISCVGVVNDGSEAADLQLAVEENDAAEDDGGDEYRPPAKKRTNRVKRFACQHCGEKFTYRKQLTKHINHIHKQSSDDAVTSGAIPAGNEAERDNGTVSTSTSGRVDPWRRYSTSFVSRAQLAARHRQRRGTATVLACGVCGKRFKSASLLTRHQCSHWRDAANRRRPTSRSHVCAVCSAQFAFPSLLAMHERRAHAPTDLVAAAAAAATASAGAAAVPDDRRSCMCSDCGRRFRSSSTLAAHVRTHTGERPYVCRVDGCAQRFAQHSTRAYHERTHSDAAPHVCTDCGRGFKHAPLLAIHARVHSGAQPYACPDCPRAFSTLGRLKVHVRSHSGERPYACTQCARRFNSTSGLRRHERAVHLGQRPFRCTVCERAFTVPGNLRTHMRTHTGEKPFVCSVCGQRFSHSGTLNGHRRTHRPTAPLTPPTTTATATDDVTEPTHCGAAEICVNPP